jgi:hypothetical protein
MKRKLYAVDVTPETLFGKVEPFEYGDASWILAKDVSLNFKFEINENFPYIGEVKNITIIGDKHTFDVDHKQDVILDGMAKVFGRFQKSY